jgi:hypothetical protein
MIDALNGWMGQYVPDYDESVSGSPIYAGLGRIADSVFDFNEGQYEKGARSVLGVEFPVGEDWWPDARENWKQLNYQLIQGDMRKYIRDIHSLTERAVTSGLTVKELSQQIQKLDEHITKARANFIARDQIGKLNGEITHRRMEDIGLSMYIWETARGDRVRGNPAGKYPDAMPSHWLMQGLLCNWNDSSVYSKDGGKTWIDRPDGAVRLHPGEDYQCYCTAIAYWQELIGEADAQIDPLSESVDNIPKTKEGLAIVKPSVDERKEKRQREENAKKAKAAADQLFPGEKWKTIEDGIFLSPRRPIGKKTNFKDEKHDALILALLGSIVYLLPEERSIPGKKYDAIVNGERFEFKNVKGASTLTLRDQFFRSRSQAPNVFINLEKSNLAKHQIIATLYGARNSPEYAKYNRFGGGKIVLKIRGQTSLTYLNVDDLKISGK